LSIEKLKQRLPELLTLANVGLKDRHWKEISNIVGFPLYPNEKLTLAKILNLNLGKFVPRLEIISDAASKENKLENRLDSMIQDWKYLNFTLLSYKYKFNEIVKF